MKSQASVTAVVPEVSVPAVKLFAAYSRQYLRRRFHAIRILKSGLPPRDITRPLVIYLNHATWLGSACLFVPVAKMVFRQHIVCPHRYRIASAVRLFQTPWHLSVLSNGRLAVR